MSRGSPSSAVCRARSFMTTPGLRWPASSVTAKRQRTRVFSELRSHTCSRTALAAPARGTTRARSRGSSAIAAGTSWSMRFRNWAYLNTHLEACCTQAMGGTTAWPRPDGRRTPGTGVRFFSAFPQSPTTATSARGGSVRCRWWIAAPRLRPHTRPLRGAGPRLCPRGGHQLRRAWPHPRSYEQEDFVFDSCTICPCWSDQRAGSRLPWPAGCSRCRRSPPPLKRGWAKPGSGNTSRCCG